MAVISGVGVRRYYERFGYHTLKDYQVRGEERGGRQGLEGLLGRTTRAGHKTPLPSRAWR